MLSVQRVTAPAGEVHTAPSRDHLLRIHAGPPARAACLERRYQYTRGDIDIFPAGTGGRWIADDPATTLTVALAPALIQQAATQRGLAHARVATQHQIRDRRIVFVARALEAEHAAAYPHGRAFADGLGFALALHVLGAYPAAPVSGTFTTAQLAQLTDYIEAHLDRPLGLPALAALLAISPSHLKARFKRTTGLAVHEYIIHRRVARARALLAAGDLPASQIALDAGFAHQSHMARWMRRLLGRTPRMIARGG